MNPVWPSFVRCLFYRAGKAELESKRQAQMGANESQRSRMQQQRVTPVEEAPDEDTDSVLSIVDEVTTSESEEDLSISFGYQFGKEQLSSYEDASNRSNLSRTSENFHSQEDVPQTSMKILVTRRNSSFSCLTGAALSANPTLANTALCNGLIGEEILPGLDSPRTFRKFRSSSSAAILELATLTPPPNDDWSLSASHITSFLNAPDVQTAGGAAGEDRVQVVCSPDDGWLYCGIYDGFNGRDAADYLAVTFYHNIARNLKLLEWHVEREIQCIRPCQTDTACIREGVETDSGSTTSSSSIWIEDSDPDEKFRQRVMHGLEEAFLQTERKFLDTVVREMDDRPELVMVGSCVLAVLMYGQDLYTLSVGDSRALLGTMHPPINSISSCKVDGDSLWAVQMTDSHIVENPDEIDRIALEHPDDAMVISGGRLKGKLRVTRAFGAGYLKDATMNNALMGILRVKNLLSPPYLGSTPCVTAHRITSEDSFVVLGSDGLFDFFTNEEVVNLVHRYVLNHPMGDPAKYMLDELFVRAAYNAGISVEQLKSVPIGGGRRKYHDDATIIIVSLDANFPTSTASISAV